MKNIVTDKTKNCSAVLAFLTNLGEHMEINIVNFGTHHTE
jgi:hypothetical protein